MESKERLYSLDLFRILCALFVFFFHSNIHIGVTYGFLTPFISQSAIFMVAFFILSGFSLYYSYSKTSFDNILDIKTFYKKRIISIYPLYIVTYVLYLLFLNTISIKQNIFIAPIELLLLQSFYDGSFEIMHNGGTWFISCIFFCYILFPLIIRIIESSSNFKKYLLLVILIFVSSISPFIVLKFHFSGIYSNPFFRLLEFIFGIIIASIFVKSPEKGSNKYIFIALFELILFFLCITYLVNNKFGVNNYVMYNFLSLPFFGLLIYH